MGDLLPVRDPLPAHAALVRSYSDARARLSHSAPPARPIVVPSPVRPVGWGAPVDFLRHNRCAFLIELVAAKHDIEAADIKGHRRALPILNARREAVHLARAHTDLSTISIGKAFGGRDHTTILNLLGRLRPDKRRRQTARERMVKEQLMAEASNAPHG
jgi:hypothetical protein